ncbi:uncharacterized protein RHOBADRAFT_55179 [Rhodotorula graminis WP1]|uniref:Sister chromatid cohesion protein n=1 Tax=Rhodotorula graminis (strain WP1) TaxID=578459 RepID=A0A0P9F1F9_RHOGW|nr:uncharacterized protein RHOBADRAFT_55179 [Rhodotorula graminis WP1]KPV73441.1 hypothetical protein RHOBADRAFT_55179 [Rhodotorula graminis WP1]
MASQPPSPGPNGASSPSVASRTAHEAITAEASHVVRGWPVGAGLQGAGDVVSHLPPILPSTPSFFPSSSSLPTSLDPATTSLVPSDPLFDQYMREIAALLAPQRGDSATDLWRDEHVQGLVGLGEVQQHPPLAPPYPILSTAQLNPAPSAHAPALAASFLAASSYPLPPPPTAPASNPLQPRHLAPQPPSHPHDTLSTFVESHYASAQASAQALSAMRRQNSLGGDSASASAPTSRPQTPSHVRVAAPHPVQMSSPDPLAMGYSSPVPAAAAPAAASAPQLAPSANGQGPHRVGAVHAPVQRRALPQVVIPQPRPRKRASSSDLSSHFSSPLKPSDAGAVRHPLPPALGGDGDFTPKTSTFKASQLEGPFTGAESAVKRVKLGAGPGANSSSSTIGRTPGTAATQGGNDPVERLGDLVGDVFTADDAFVGDTSSAAVSSHMRSPSRKGGEKRLFRSTRTSESSNAPLLHTDALRRMLGLLRAVASRGKAEELVEEVEEGGVQRWLRVLERSWEGIGDAGGGWEGWDAEAGDAREDDGAGQAGKGKGKGKGKKGGRKGSASPAKGASKGKAKGRRSSAAVDEENEEDDGDFDMLASASPGRTGTRRSSRSASPRRDRSSTIDVDGDDEQAAAHDEGDSRRTGTASSGESYWDVESRLASTEASLRDLSDALLALRLALEILTLPGVALPKHLFSSEYLLGVVSSLRRALDACLVPILEAPATSPLAELATSRARDKVAEVTDALVAGTQALAALVKAEDLGDELVIALAYLSLEPFFHEAPLATTAAARAAAARDLSPAVNAVKGLRLASLAVVQAVYARYADQRAWIVEEVLSNLGKAESATGTAVAKKAARRGIRIRTGATIQTVSALLLHLVQTCPADLASQIRKKLAKSTSTDGGVTTGGADVDMDDDLGLGTRVLGPAETQGEGEGEGDILERPNSSIQKLLSGALDMSNKAARTIIGFLLQRAAKAGKTTGATADTEYRAVFDHLVADLLATLHLAEWPGAEVLLTVLCRSMMATLADSKSTHESNSLKTIALEHIGVIAARIRNDLSVPTTGLKSLREAAIEGDDDTLEKTILAHKSVVEHVVKVENVPGSAEGAASFSRAQLALDALQALPHSGAAPAVHDRLVALVGEVWNDDQVEDVFGPSADDSQPRVDALALELWRFSTLANLYQPILTRIVDASESAQMGQRAKALRAISLVVAQDPDLFNQDNIRRSIENRMLDSSPMVRDASIELVGKYVVTRPDLAVQYLPRLGERISDTGLGVRRRVIKLLRVLYHVVASEEHKVDISRKLVYRVLDEDDGIKDLAIDALEDIWFSTPSKNVAKDSIDSLAQLASIITQTAGVFKDRPPPVDEALRLIMSKHAEKGTEPPLERLKLVMESLIDGLVEDERNMDVVAGIKTVFLLSSVDPNLLSTAKATLLLPFLKSAATPDEQIISDYLLRIFRAAVVAMPKSATKFGRDLQAALMPMLNKPTHNVSILQGVVACFCAVVHGQTQDFATMIRAFVASLKRLQQEAHKLVHPETAQTVQLRTLPVLCYMAALLCEHGEFDRVREEHAGIKSSIDELTPNSVAELTYGTLIRVYNLSLPAQIKSTVLTSLGFVYRAHPTLMLHQASTAIIDAIFESPAPQMHHQILRIIQDFLASQERAVAVAAALPVDKKRKKAINGVKMEELVGNVEGFADSGVASAISQRYLKRIIASALSPNPSLQRLGLDLLNTIARSGFSHPITLAPTLVALTASGDAALANKAYATLAILHQKHASLLVTRFLEPARAAHTFAVSAVGDGETLRGYRGDPPESLLGRWYSLLHKEKRQVQLDFLKTLSRSFELEIGSPCSSVDVSFFRFLAEALSTFDFKRTEEPLLVVALLNSALAVSGMQVLHALEQDLEGGGGLMATASPSKKLLFNDAAIVDAERAPSPDLARQSLVLGLALLLRDHLKRLYSLSDAKLAKYVVGKKSAMGDKAASRHADAPVALGSDGYGRMPLVLVHPEMNGEDERCGQRATFMRLVAEDGTIAAMEELEADTGDDA